MLCVMFSMAISSEESRMEERVGSHFLFYVFLGSILFSQEPKGHLPSFLLEHFLNLKSGCFLKEVGAAVTQL